MQTSTLTLQFVCEPPLVPTGATLPLANPGVPYGPIQLGATGGVPPYTFTSSNLPPGISLSPSGVLSGTPTTAGVTNIVVTVTDSGP
jgi:hypothetical protein